MCELPQSPQTPQVFLRSPVNFTFTLQSCCFFTQGQNSLDLSDRRWYLKMCDSGCFTAIALVVWFSSVDFKAFFEVIKVKQWWCQIVLLDRVYEFHPPPISPVLHTHTSTDPLHLLETPQQVLVWKSFSLHPLNPHILICDSALKELLS